MVKFYQIWSHWLYAQISMYSSKLQRCEVIINNSNGLDKYTYCAISSQQIYLPCLLFLPPVGSVGFEPPIVWLWEGRVSHSTVPQMEQYVEHESLDMVRAGICIERTLVLLKWHQCPQLFMTGRAGHPHYKTFTHNGDDYRATLYANGPLKLP